MSKHLIKQLVESKARQDGLTETGVKGVQLFRSTASLPCVPAVYEPCVIAIVSGAKEALLDGRRYVYDSSQYMCCPMSMPVQAGTPAASAENPLYGVFISLDLRMMTELAIELDSAEGTIRTNSNAPLPQGIRLANWDAGFAEALLRLLQLGDSKVDTAVLGAARLRELYYAILKGEAGFFAKQAFAPANPVARTIVHLSNNLNSTITVDELAERAGLSRAVFHRKFKQATTMSPIQFIKSMRLNTAAMQIAGGITVSEAALDVGYASPSQFSREFKRLYGQSPRQWKDAQNPTTAIA